MWIVFFFKPKTAYELRISDWSSDVCSSDLVDGAAPCRFRRDRVVGLQAPQIVPQADSGTEQDRHDGNMQAVDKAGLEVDAHPDGSDDDPHIAVCDMYAMLQRERLHYDGGHTTQQPGGNVTQGSALGFGLKRAV